MHLTYATETNEDSVELRRSNRASFSISLKHFGFEQVLTVFGSIDKRRIGRDSPGAQSCVISSPFSSAKMIPCAQVGTSVIVSLSYDKKYRAAT
jgi:hypothetical protein